MTPHRFNGKLVMLAIIGFILFIGSAQFAAFQKDDSMQPVLATPMVTKAQATAAATDFFTKTHPSLIVSETSIIYETNKTLSAYLQKNKLTKDYKKKHLQTVPLDFWLVQIWDELSTTRYIVQVGMDAPATYSWNYKKNSELNASVLDNADEPEAREIAEAYLNQAGFKLLGFEQKPATVKADSFVFEYDQLPHGNYQQQLIITVKDTQVIAFHTDYIVPESDTAWIDQQEEYGRVMSLVSLLCMLIFAITAIVISIVKRKLISFSRGWILTALFLVISVIGTFNTLPSAGGELGDINASVLLVIYLVLTIGVNVLLAAAVYFALVTGVQMWKERGWNAWSSWKEARFGADVFYGMGRGYLICIFVIGVQQVLFLIAGNTFHAFAINDPSQSEYNMVWPLLFPTLAWMAAISEEIIFRLFGIAIFQKILRFRFLAILIPSIIWALGHTSYSLYPSYTRLIEVAVLGIIFSITFLRYGLITAIFAHAIMDSLLMGLSLIYAAEQPSYIYIGLFYIVFPAILGYTIRFLKRQRGKSDMTPGRVLIE